MINEQLEILAHRLTSKQLPTAYTLLNRMLDNIDTNLAQQNHTVEQNSSSTITSSSSNSFEQMQKFKYDIIQQSVIISQAVKINKKTRFYAIILTFFSG
jgi:hypothetical protein